MSNSTNHNLLKIGNRVLKIGGRVLRGVDPNNPYKLKEVPMLQGDGNRLWRQGCFSDCGRDTESGRAELAQIPSDWGGTGA